MSKLEKVSAVFFAIVVAVLGIRLIHEPDIWWMLRTGEWIVQNGTVPETDPFSYTFQGTDWLNVKWLFEVVLYTIASVFGVQWIIVMQVLVNLLITYFLHRIFRLLGGSNWLPFWLLAAIGLFAWEFRMVGRPEMTSHLLSVVFMFLWLRHRQKKDRWIWLIVPLQMVWVNLHEAYATGGVISTVMLLGLVMDQYGNDKKFLFKEHRWEIAVLLLSGATTSLHPYGIKMWLQPFEIFSQLGENKFTTELFSISKPYYWNRKEVYLVLGMLVLFVIGVLYSRKKRQMSFNNFGWGAALITVLFGYLATTAHRNIPFFVFVLVPFGGALISGLISDLRPKFYKTLLVVSVVISVGIYAAISSNFYYSKTQHHDRFGIGVSAWNNPIGASTYLGEQQITGKCFSDYLVSSYLLWDRRPDFRSYIDLRDLDVFPASFFNSFLRSASFPQQFAEEDAKRNFDYAVLYRPQFQALHRYFYNAPEWEMQFADPVAVVYTKTGRFDNVEQAGFQPPQQDILYSGVSRLLTKALWPFPGAEVVDRSYELIGAEYFTAVGDYNQALNQIEKAKGDSRYQLKAQLKEAELYLKMADDASTQQEQQRVLGKAVNLYNRVLQRDPDNAQAYFGSGYAFFKARKPVEAQTQLLKAVKHDPAHFEAYTVLAECQNMFMQTDPNNQAGYQNKWFEYMLKAHDIKPSDQLTNYKLGVSYCQRNNCEKAGRFLEGLTRLPMLSEQQNSTLLECQRKCGVR